MKEELVECGLPTPVKTHVSCLVFKTHTGWPRQAQLADGSRNTGQDHRQAPRTPQAAASENNIGRQWSSLKYVAREPLQPGPRLPFSVVPRQKLAVADVMRILRHDQQSEPDPDARNSRFVCALCSGATQTSFVAQLKRTAPADIGLVYWVSLASPRTSFYIPFHFGIADFPAQYRMPSQRPTREEYDRRVQAPFTPNPHQAFWLFSNFADKIDDEGPALATIVRADAERVEREAIAMQSTTEEAAQKLYSTDRRGAMRFLENHSKRVYSSRVEAMTALLAEK